jgi:hypothetical protein
MLKMIPLRIQGAAVSVLVLAAWAGQGLAGYKIPVSACTGGGGRGTATKYELTYTIGQSSPTGPAVASGYELSSGLMATLSDVVPPAIVHQPAAQVPARTSVEILTEITDQRSGIDTVRLFFREGGYYAFREKPMLKTSGNTYSATLPPSSVTERGLVYYIEAADGKGNVGRYPDGAPDSLVNLTVAFADLASPGLPAGAYRMVSLPGLPIDGSPDSVIADDLGFYGRKAWRLGRWNATGCQEQRCYDEYPEVEDFAPGRAFWLITGEARTFDFSGASTNISLPYAVRLARGWNQIGTPFGFATDWLSAEISYAGNSYTIGDLHVAGPDTIFVEDNLISYDGSYHGFRTQLAPWEGYWIYNASSTAVDLMLDPGTAQAAAGRVAEGLPGKWDFVLKLRVKSHQGREASCFAGVSQTASDSWDVMDRHAPPTLDDFLSVGFPRPDWGPNSGAYLADIRKSCADGASWDLRVETSGQDHASIAVEAEGDLPAGWKVFLYDVDAGLRLDSTSLPHNFDLAPSRDFVLVAGTDAFIAAEEASGRIELRPGIVAAIPNPFSQTVRVTYFVPSGGRARLQVFSTEGRVVRTIEEGAVEAGIHSVIWDGRSEAGRSAAPGVYFVRLETQGTSQARKVMKIR